MSRSHRTVAGFLANGGGAVTFRLLATALGVAILWLLRFEGEQLNARLDRIESAMTAVAAIAQTASAQGEVDAARVSALDAAAAELRHTLDDHEHRISELEGARHR
ncbi:MAG TPA: hypothetical protein VGL35_12095 [Rhizomicrobium sp.]|jgi:hypothetical protein